MILLVGTHEVFYYFLYVATGSFMAMIYAFFIPFTVSVSSGMFSCMPYGEQIANVVLVLFFAPNVLYELVSSGKLFEGSLWTCLPLFAVIIAVLLFLAIVDVHVAKMPFVLEYKRHIDFSRSLGVSYVPRKSYSR